MRKVFALFALLVFLNCITQAGDLDKVFKYINTGNYDKALQNIREELISDPGNAAANFAMAKLYSSKDYNRYNIDSAAIYINKVYLLLPFKTDDKQAKKFLKLGVRDFTVKALFDEINNAAFEKAKSINSETVLDHFIHLCLDSSLTERAIDMRDENLFFEAKARADLELLKQFLNAHPHSKKFAEANILYEKLLYESMTQADSYQAYKSYFEKFPTGPYAAEAKSKFELRLLENCLKRNNLDSYAEFEKENPNSRYIEQVQDSIYRLCTKGGMAPDYLYFIETYKHNRNILTAWNRLYEFLTKRGTDSDYVFFEKTYPQSPLKERIKKDRKLLALSLMPFKQGEKYGYVNTENHMLVIEPRFSEASEFSNGLAVVSFQPCSDTCKYFYIDKSGKIAIESSFTSAGDFINGFAVVSTDWCAGDACNYGIIDRMGDFSVAPVYNELTQAGEGLFIAMEEGHGYGYIDARGKVRIPFGLEDAGTFGEGLVPVRRAGQWLFLDPFGHQIFPSIFRNASGFSFGLAAVSANDSTYGYIDKTGRWVINPSFDYAESFAGDSAIVTIRENNKKSKDFGLSYRYKIDRQGNLCYKLSNPVISAAANRKKNKPGTLRK